MEGMGSTGTDETIMIKIRITDSETYSLRVNKQISIAELKEQIASVTNVLSEQQRLIYCGSFLKDDQLLSAYNVEDGHTLHLAVRPPVAPSAVVPNDLGSLLGLNLRRLRLNFWSTGVAENNETSQGEVANEAENSDVGTSRQQNDVQET